MEASKQTDAQDSARNKSKDDTLEEEGFARFCSGVCLKKRETSKIRKRSRNSSETLTVGNQRKRLKVALGSRFLPVHWEAGHCIFFPSSSKVSLLSVPLLTWDNLSVVCMQMGNVFS